MHPVYYAVAVLMPYSVLIIPRDTDFLETQAVHLKNCKVGYPTYPIPLSQYLSHPLVHAPYVDLGGCEAAAKGRRAILGAAGHFEAISKQFRSDFEPFSAGFIATLSVLGSPGHISSHHTSLKALSGRPKTISHFAISHHDPTLK